MLSKDLKEKWITALRSDEFKQTDGQLRDKHGYCCLGVLCVVAGFEINEEGTEIIKNELDKGYEPVIELIGKDIVDELWKMNDNQKKIFPKIADWIEENL